MTNVNSPACAETPPGSLSAKTETVKTSRPLPQPSPTEITRARTIFPRGLYQPEDSFHFSMDALLLAAFAMEAPQGTAPREHRVADLGTGCGAVALAMLLHAHDLRVRGHIPAHCPVMTAAGWDIDRELTDAATHNAMLLGLARQFTVHTGDIALIRETHMAETADMVVANPPYRRPEQGRMPASTRRTRALFETEGALETFIRAAAYLVRNRQKFCSIYPAERLPDLITTCRNARLEPKRLRMVHSKADTEAILVLLETRKNAKPGCITQPPLILYAGQGAATTLTPLALSFCPHLACNPRGPQPDGDCS